MQNDLFQLYNGYKFFYYFEYCQKYNELVVAIEEANDCKIISA